MHYDDMFLFVQLIEKGSFSSLSRYTGITQSTISRRISQLEDYLGVKLLKRNTRGLFEATEAGANLFAKFKNISDDINSCVDEIKTTNEYTGVLRIALPRVFLSLVIVPVIHKFQQMYPNIQLVFSYSAGDVDLIRDNLDLAIAIKSPKNQNYKQRLLISSNNYLYVSNGYIEKYGNPESLTDLAQKNHQIIGSSFDYRIYDKLIAFNSVSEELSEINFLPKIITNNALSNLDFALTGGYIVNAAECLVRHEVASGNLIKLLPDLVPNSFRN